MGPQTGQDLPLKEIGGKLIRGVYKMAGRKGHYDVKNFEKKTALTETEEHNKKDAKKLFAAESLKNKTEAIQAAFQENQKEREAQSVPANLLDSEGILAMLQNAGLSVGAAAASGLGKSADAECEQASESDGEHADSMSSDDRSEGEAAQARLAALGGRKAKAAAKAKASAKSSMTSGKGPKTAAVDKPQASHAKPAAPKQQTAPAPATPAQKQQRRGSDAAAAAPRPPHEREPDQGL